MTIRFGTAGWRAIIAQDFTFENVRTVSQAIADYLKSQRLHHKQMIIGYDTRFLSEEFAAAATQVLIASGVQVLLCKRDVPTPTIAWEIMSRKAAGAINVTASHNPHEYSGIKFSTSWGGPALPEVTRDLEERCMQIKYEKKAIPQMSLDEGRRKKLLIDIDPMENYKKQIRKLIDFSLLKKAKLSVVCDVMYGTARGYLDDLLREAGCKVTVLNDHRDVLFGGRHPEPDKENLSSLVQIMKKQKAHIGLGTDGDADRFGIVDSDGSFLTPNEILPLVLDHLVTTRNWKGVAARSVMTSHFFDAVAKMHGIEMRETPVGFKYIADVMLKEEFIVGGEESGGLTIKGHIPDKDGILACMLLAEVRAAGDKKTLRQRLIDLQKKVGFFHTERMNFHISPDKMDKLKDALSSKPPTNIGNVSVRRIIDMDGFKFILRDQSWIGIRLSGTEPVVRLYAEASDAKKLATLIEFGKKLITK